MTTASLLIIGSEMLDPARRDANGPVAREGLSSLGIPVVFSARVEDRVESVTEALRSAMAVGDVVITSGGLGPTGDDVTREAVAGFLGVGVRPDPGWIAELEQRYGRMKRPFVDRDKSQGFIVEGGDAIPNAAGLACGCWLKTKGKDLILLPGVPREFRRMMGDEVVPRLAALHGDGPKVRVVKAVAAGLPEVEAEKTLAPLYGRPGTTVSILPSAGIQRITVSLSSPPIEEPAEEETRIREALGKGLGRHLVSLDGTELEERLGRDLLRLGWSLACAESCTAGLIARKVVAIPGASGYFLGGVVAYHDDAKRRLLGVPGRVLERNGAVSEAAARAMVRGARARFGASCAVATTGIAGPTGGRPGKPVGTLWIAAATPRGEWARKLFFPVERGLFTELATNTALFTLWRRLQSEGGP